MTAFEGRGLGFSYGGPKLFSGVNISVEQGECVALTGASGCGKSTLCYILSGIIPRSVEGEPEGEVLLFGDEIGTLPLSEVISRVGVVFQNPDSQLFSPTVEDEIAFGPENLCLPRGEIGKRIEDSLAAVGMEKYRFAGPEQLSGGQRQLVAMAAVLALEPRALIFDEALSQLDEESTALVKAAVCRQKEAGRAIIFVEHDPDNFDIADRVLYMKDGGLKEACE